MMIVNNVINKLIDYSPYIFIRLFRYIFNRAEGFDYGSYSLKDEVELAVSLINYNLNGAIIDAGANIGDWSKLIIKSIPQINLLIAIEPQKGLADNLQVAFSLNEKVIIENVALSAQNGENTLYMDEKGSPLASLYPRNISHHQVAMSKHEIVRAVTLDTLSEKHQVSTISFLKLDLEGHELEALKGSINLLNKQAINALIFEFGGCNIDSRTYIKDFWVLLVEKYGFTLYRLLPKRRLMKLSRYSEHLEQFNWQNILALSPLCLPPRNYKIFE